MNTKIFRSLISPRKRIRLAAMKFATRAPLGRLSARLNRLTGAHALAIMLFALLLAAPISAYAQKPPVNVVTTITCASNPFNICQDPVTLTVDIAKAPVRQGGLSSKLSQPNAKS